jgi:hypothetical protein
MRAFLHSWGKERGFRRPFNLWVVGSIPTELMLLVGSLVNFGYVQAIAALLKRAGGGKSRDVGGHSTSTARG